MLVGQKDKFTIETNEWRLHIHAAVVPPLSVLHHGHTVFGRPRVVRLTFLPLPVVQALLPQRPFPAANIVVQTDPEGHAQVFGQVVDSVDVSLIRHSGQVTVLCPTFVLRLRPVQLQLSEQDVLMDVDGGTCWVKYNSNTVENIHWLPPLKLNLNVLYLPPASFEISMWFNKRIPGKKKKTLKIETQNNYMDTKGYVYILCMGILNFIE